MFIPKNTNNYINFNKQLIIMKQKIFSYSKNNLINLRIVPNTSKNEFIFDEENKNKINNKTNNTNSTKIKVKIQSLPEDGKANAELIKFFKKNGIKIEIVKGLKSRDKIVRVIEYFNNHKF